MDAANLGLRAMTSQDIVQALELWGGCEGVGLSDSDHPEQLAAFLQRNPGLSWVAVRAEWCLVPTLRATSSGRGLAGNGATISRPTHCLCRINVNAGKTIRAQPFEANAP
jgi:hypothetical protein